MATELSQRARRMRWRLRGAWLGPAFVLLTIVDTILIRVQPLAGEGKTDWIAAFLLAGSINLIVVAALGQLGGWWLRRRRPDLPKVVADNYAGTALLFVVTAAFLGFGLAHRSDANYEANAVREASAAGGEYLARNAPAEFRAGVASADLVRIDRDIYRVCAIGADPAVSWCVIVSTDTNPPGITRDRNREPNASLDGLREIR
ncbi:MAG: hypothetical protein JHC84_07920 [Solirubrobacteraceae bacterium]|nr:hypothetical protein [Solirubrobacteraceae bacterium]